MTKIQTARKRIEIADRLWGWKPHPTQREWLLDEHQIKVAACGRRWGKTESAAVDVATYAITHRGSVQIIVAPTYDQSRLIGNTVERLLLSHAAIRPYVRVTRTPYPDIRFGPSRIMARTADDDGRNLRGHSADRVVVDEAAFVRDKVVEEVIGPMLADHNGRLIMISTPFGKNHFYRAFVEGHRPDNGSDAADHGLTCRTRSFRFPSWANPHISRDYIAYQKSTLSERQFRVEYEAEFVDDLSSVFPWDDIQACVTDDGTGTITDDGVRVAGIDWARYSDYTAVVVIEVAQPESRPTSRVLCVDRFNRMDWKSQVERVAELLCRYGVSAVAADQTSAGDPVLEMLGDRLWHDRGMDVEIEGVVFTSQSKRELIDNLAVRLANREVTFPRIEALVNELQYYEYELTEAGNVRTGARQGYHDDCVCALALALRMAPRYISSDRFLTSGRRRVSMGR